ncbi:MAG: hypothetical protein AB4063_03435 [Crocosphaera sp.]
MTHPQTVKQYRKFFANLGISHLEIREKFGDLRKRETWEKAYSDYTYPNLPIIKAIDEAIAQKETQVIFEPATVCVAQVIRALEVLEFVESFSTLEGKPELASPKSPLVPTIYSSNTTPEKADSLVSAETPRLPQATPTLFFPPNLSTPSQILPLPKLGKPTLGCWVNLPTKISISYRGKFRGGRSPPKLKLSLA